MLCGFEEIYLALVRYRSCVLTEIYSKLIRISLIDTLYFLYYSNQTSCLVHRAVSAKLEGEIMQVSPFDW